MRIEKLKLEEIGPFDSLELDFAEKSDPEKAEIHILTGPNGCGKSTILYALAGIFGENGPINKRFREPGKSYFEIGIESELFHFKSLPSKDEMSLYKNDGLFRVLNVTYAKILKDYNNKLFPELEYIILAYSGNRQYETTEITSVLELDSDPLEKSLTFNDAVAPAKINQWIANTKAKLAFAIAEKDEDKINKYLLPVENLEKIISEIIEMEVSFLFKYEALEVNLSLDGQIIEFDLLPDGVKSVISWLSDLLMRMDRVTWIDDRPVFEREFILLLDEIDIHLHPRWQRKVLPVVQKHFKNAQIFVSTHSPFVVGSVEGARVYSFEVEKGVSTLRKVDDSKAGSSYELIMDDIFNVKERFDVETEAELKLFYEQRDALMHKEEVDEDKFKALIAAIKKRSYELNDIMALELIQLKRVTGRDFSHV